MKRFAAIVMFIGAVLAGGGARFAHVMVAHSGCRAEAEACGTPTSCHTRGHAHAHGGHAHPVSADQGDCAICDELASLTPTLSAPCTLLASLELLALLDAREASQIEDPAPIAASFARPPPVRA